MEVVKISISDIKPYEKNAKLHPQEQIEQIKKSIEEFGMNDPIAVWGNENIIIEGHGRLEALKQLGYTEVECIRLDHLTDEERKAYTLAHNKLTMNSDFDFDLLTQELDEITNIDMSDFGFDLDLGYEEPQEVVEDNFEAELPPEPVAKFGDIWKLGEHRLMCGDSTSIDDVEKLMDGEKADLVFTDPPYGLKKESDGVANDNLNFDDLLEFNRQWIPLSLNALKDTGCWYCWGIDEPLMDIYSAILKPLKRENKIVVRNYITWAKHSAIGVNSAGALSYPKETEKAWFIMKGMDRNNNNTEFFNTKFERILEYMQQEAAKANLTPKDVERITGVKMYGHWFSKAQFSIISEQHYDELHREYPQAFTKPYADLRKMLGDSNNPTAELKPYFDNIALERVGDIGLTDVWRFTTTSKTERELTGGHATPKPIALCCRGINASSRKGERVLDLFGGSGSTLIACEQLERKAYLMELEPKWVDVIINRWEKFTGKKAELLEQPEEYYDRES